MRHNIRRTALALPAATTLAGCIQKASWLPNEQGGYKLFTNAATMEQAATRFRRTADDLCRGSRYALTEPIITDRGWQFRAGGGGAFGGTTIAVQTELACK
jgi:hypothetical protein